MKTLILKVYTRESDYGALTFEQNSCTVKEFAEDIKEGGCMVSRAFFNGTDDPSKVLEITGELIVLDSLISKDDWDKIRLELLDVDLTKYCNYYWVENVSEFFTGIELQQLILSIISNVMAFVDGISLSKLSDIINESEDGLVSTKRIQNALNDLVLQDDVYLEGDNYKTMVAPSSNS